MAMLTWLSNNPGRLVYEAPEGETFGEEYMELQKKFFRLTYNGNP